MATCKRAEILFFLCCYLDCTPQICATNLFRPMLVAAGKRQPFLAAICISLRALSFLTPPTPVWFIETIYALSYLRLHASPYFDGSLTCCKQLAATAEWRPMTEQRFHLSSINSITGVCILMMFCARCDAAVAHSLHNRCMETLCIVCARLWQE